MVQTSGTGDISQKVTDFPAAPNNIYLRKSGHTGKVDILVRLQCPKRESLYQAQRDWIGNWMLLKSLRKLEEQKSGGCQTVGLKVTSPFLWPSQETTAASKPWIWKCISGTFSHCQDSSFRHTYPLSLPWKNAIYLISQMSHESFQLGEPNSYPKPS